MIESPVDFFKTQMQVQLNRVRENRHNKSYVPQFTGVSDAARVIIRENGMIGAYQVQHRAIGSDHTFIVLITVFSMP